MGPTWVQNPAGNSSASASVSAAFGSNITAGNLIEVVATCDSGTVPSGTAVTDNNGNTYSLIKSQAGVLSGGSNTGSVGLYQARNCNAGATTVTFNNTGNAGGATFVGISIAEYNPNGQATPDATAGNNASTTGTPNPGNLVDSNNDDLLIAGATNAINNTTWSAGASWNLRGVVNSATNTTVALQDQSVAASGTYSSAFGNSSTAGWTAAAAAIKAVVSATSKFWPQMIYGRQPPSIYDYER